MEKCARPTCTVSSHVLKAPRNSRRYRNTTGKRHVRWKAQSTRLSHMPVTLPMCLVFHVCLVEVCVLHRKGHSYSGIVNTPLQVFALSAPISLTCRTAPSFFWASFVVPIESFFRFSTSKASPSTLSSQRDGLASVFPRLFLPFFRFGDSLRKAVTARK